MEDSTTNSLIRSIAILSRNGHTLIQRTSVNALTGNPESSGGCILLADSRDFLYD